MIINRVSGSFVLYCIGSSHGCFFLSVSQKGRKGLHLRSQCAAYLVLQKCLEKCPDGFSIQGSVLYP